MDHVPRVFLSILYSILGPRWTGKLENLAAFAKEKFQTVKDCPHGPAFQSVLWTATIFLAIPFKMTLTEKGYTRLTIPKFPVRLLSSILLADIIAHAFVMVSVALKKNMTIIAPGGSVTIDGLVYFTANVGITLTIPYFIKFHWDAENIIGLSNACQKFVADYTEKFLQGRHPFKIYQRDAKLNILAAIFPCINVSVGFCAAVLVFLYRQSPMLMASYIADLEVNWISPFILQLIGIAHNAAIMSIVFFGILFLTALLAQYGLETAFILRTLRENKSVHSSLMGLRHQHAVVEVVVAASHQVAGFMIPLFVWHVLLAAVLCVAAAVKVANVPGVPFFIVAVFGFGVIFGLVSGIWCIVRLAEDIRSESLDFNNWLERQMLIIKHRKRKESPKWRRINCRMFRRRAVGIRMGFLYQVEAGLAMDYLQTIFDKAISLILMVDGSYPVTLMFP